jgi:O-antigen ligase
MKKLMHRINFEKTYSYILPAFAFMLPLSRATNSLFVGMLILLLILQGNYRSHIDRLKHSSFALSILLFIALTLLSLLWTDNLKEGLNTKLLYIQWFAIFAIALNVKKDQIYKIISAFILGMVVSEILSYGMFFELWTIKGHGKAYPSPFMMHIDYSIFLAFTAVILLNRLLSKRYTPKEKWIILFFFLTISGNLFINEGRTGQLAFVAGIFATVFIHYRVTFKSILGALLLIAIIFSSAYHISDKFQARVQAAQNDIHKITEGQLNSSLGIRYAMYSVARDIFEEHPLIGVGVGDYKDAAKEALYKNDHGFAKEVVDFIPKYHFHSQYLNTLVQGGIIGLFLLLMVFYHFATLSISDPELKELSILIVILFMVGFLPEPLLMKQFTNTLFILFAGLFLGASLQNRGSEQKKQTAR